MIVIATDLATSSAGSSGREDGLFLRVIRKLLPAANPDFGDLYRQIRLWWVEVDADGVPQREVGFGLENQVLVVGPLEGNVGFWTDSDVVFSGPEYGNVDPNAFEAYWSRFVAAWYAARRENKGA